MTYRNKKLLEACRSIPCQSCGSADGTVCAAHANLSELGKGMGIKASDASVAALCACCHARLDQGRDMNKAEKRDFWLTAYAKTMRELFERGMVVSQ